MLQLFQPFLRLSGVYCGLLLTAGKLLGKRSGMSQASPREEHEPWAALNRANTHIDTGRRVRERSTTPPRLLTGDRKRVLWHLQLRSEYRIVLASDPGSAHRVIYDTNIAAPAGYVWSSTTRPDVCRGVGTASLICQFDLYFRTNISPTSPEGTSSNSAEDSASATLAPG